MLLYKTTQSKSAQYFHSIYLVGSTEERFSSVHLYQDATQGPHVNSQVIGHSKQHLWGAIEATLDILVYLQKEHSQFRRLYYNTLGGTFLYKFILLMIKKTAHRYPLSQLA